MIKLNLEAMAIASIGSTDVARCYFPVPLLLSCYCIPPSCAMRIFGLANKGGEKKLTCIE